MSEHQIVPCTDFIKPEVLIEFERYATENELPEYLRGFAGSYLADRPYKVAGMLRAVRCTSPEFWVYAEEFCASADGGSHNMERLLYELMWAGRTIATRTEKKKLDRSAELLKKIEKLLKDLDGDPLAQELTVPMLAKTRATDALNDLQTSLDYVEPQTKHYFDDNDQWIDDVEQAMAEGINLNSELQTSERESFICGLIVGPNLTDLLKGAAAAYEKELNGDSVLGPLREHTATPLHPRKNDNPGIPTYSRRIYFYKRVIDWFGKLSHGQELKAELISITLDAILRDENASLVDDGDPWKSALREVKERSGKK